MMKRLIQTQEESIVYGNFRDKFEEELFRCPRKLDAVDLRNYVNENRCFLGFEQADGNMDLHSEGYKGYFRMYFRDGWYGSWIDANNISRLDCSGVNEICQKIDELFPKGCDYYMKEFLKTYKVYDGEGRYLLKPILSDHYKVLFDTNYGNGDYPVRIYVYNGKCGAR